MAKIRPFRAYRPIRELVSEIAALPYDVMDTEEAKEMVKNNKLSFLHVDRGEINFNENIDPHNPIVYQKSKDVLDNMIESGLYLEEEKPCYYIYRQIMGERSQTGLVICASIDDYLNNKIKKHEKTRKDKELDRINHVNICDAHTGPIFLTYRKKDSIANIINLWTQTSPIYNFESSDGNKHTVWIIDDDKTINDIIKLFQDIDFMYIADGHHRCESAAKVGMLRRQQNSNYTGEEEFNYFLAIAYQDSELKVLDYNRTVKDLNNLTVDEFIKKVEEKFDLKIQANNVAVKPTERHTFGMYLDGQWYFLQAKEGSYDENDPMDRLDVSILQNNLLGPILGIDDPTKSERIDFIGGIRGVKELERRANKDMRVSFSMCPTTIDDIMSISDVGKIMPPKSTWFEPKPRSGIFIHKLNS